MSIAEKSGRPERDSDLRCQSGPSAKNSVIFSGGDSSKNYGADQQRLQISDLHFDKFPTPATFACWKIRFKTEVCTCSQFPTEAMQWIKEVELVDSVDDLRSSSSVRGISMPDFEVLDARIASALNKIIRLAPVAAPDSDSEWDALLDAHGLTPPPGVHPAAGAQSDSATGAGRRARDKRRRRVRRAAKRSMWRDI